MLSKHAESSSGDPVGVNAWLFRNLPGTYQKAQRAYYRVRRLYYHLRLRNAGEIRIVLQPPFDRVGRHGFRVYAAPIHWLADRRWPPYESPLRLFESGRPLGPAHGTPEEVTQHGCGTFVHLGVAVLFSTSDNSDPNHNGRSYVAVALADPAVPLIRWRLWLHAALWGSCFWVLLGLSLALAWARDRRQDRGAR